VTNNNYFCLVRFSFKCRVFKRVYALSAATLEEKCVNLCVCSMFRETAAGVDGRYVTVTSCRRLGSRGTSAAVYAASPVSRRSTRNDPASSVPVSSTVVPTTTGQLTSTPVREVVPSETSSLSRSARVIFRGCANPSARFTLSFSRPFYSKKNKME